MHRALMTALLAGLLTMPGSASLAEGPPSQARRPGDSSVAAQPPEQSAPDGGEGAGENGGQNGGEPGVEEWDSDILSLRATIESMLRTWFSRPAGSCRQI